MNVREQETKEIAAENVLPEEPTAKEVPASSSESSRGRTARSRRGRGTSRRTERARSEFDQKVIDVRRVTRVVAGGRRFTFRVSLIIGDKKGSVGVGIGKGGDTALAIEKAARHAKKNLVRVPVTSSMSIPHNTRAKYAASEVLIYPASGKGLSAGSSLRHVLELAGLKDVGAKILSRSKNRLNIARAGVKALARLRA